ncbi:hypothetical protein BKA81DRAFT_36996 [Phyllosticta paracitricarpa]
MIHGACALSDQSPYVAVAQVITRSLSRAPTAVAFAPGHYCMTACSRLDLCKESAGVAKSARQVRELATPSFAPVRKGRLARLLDSLTRCQLLLYSQQSSSFLFPAPVASTSFIPGSRQPAGAIGATRLEVPSFSTAVTDLSLSLSFITSHARTHTFLLLQPNPSLAHVPPSPPTTTPPPDNALILDSLRTRRRPVDLPPTVQPLSLSSGRTVKDTDKPAARFWRKQNFIRSSLSSWPFQTPSRSIASPLLHPTASPP